MYSTTSQAEAQKKSKYENEHGKEICFICDNEAGTEEHIIPQWLQKKFNLQQQSVTISNGEKVKYRNLKIPCCKNCNTDVWCPLEQKISTAHTNMPTDLEIWYWAAKIHYGLNYKDKFLDWDIRQRGKKISEVFDTRDPLEKAKRFLHCISGKFKTDPSPFGSVFTFKFKDPQEFFFSHQYLTSSICICIGTVGFIVFVEDGQLVKKSGPYNTEYQRLLSLPSLNVHDMKFLYANMFYDLARTRWGYDLMLIPNPGILTLTNFTIKEQRSFNEKEFQGICNAFGLTWKKPTSGEQSDVAQLQNPSTSQSTDTTETLSLGEKLKKIQKEVSQTSHTWLSTSAMLVFSSPQTQEAHTTTVVPPTVNQPSSITSYNEEATTSSKSPTLGRQHSTDD